MKIGIFMFDLTSGGAEKIMVGFVNYLSQNTNDEVVLILANSNGPYLSIVDKKVKVISLDVYKTLKTILPLYKVLKQEKPDVLYSTLQNANISNIVMGRLLGFKSIIREANTIAIYNKVQKKTVDNITLKLSKLLYRYAFRCIAISENVKKDLIKFTSISAEKVKVIYNPIMIIDKVPNVKLDGEIFHVGLVSRLATQKNIPTVAKIIEAFIKSGQKIRFHFFGEGPEQALLENLVKQYNNTSIIEFHGFEISYFSYVKQMQAFLHIPLWEGLGNSVLEVFNSGIPMILSDVDSGFAELIKPEMPNVHYFQPLTETDKITGLLTDYVNKKIQLTPNRAKLKITENDTYKSYRDLAN